MKRWLFLFFVLSLITYVVNAQNNVLGKAFYSYNVSDTVAAKATRTSLQNLYGSSAGLYFDKARNKWKIWVGTCTSCAQDSTWIDLILNPTVGGITTLNNGLTKTGTLGQLGGALVKNTTISQGTGFSLALNPANLLISPPTNGNIAGTVLGTGFVNFVAPSGNSYLLSANGSSFSSTFFDVNSVNDISLISTTGALTATTDSTFNVHATDSLNLQSTKGAKVNSPIGLNVYQSTLNSANHLQIGSNFIQSQGVSGINKSILVKAHNDGSVYLSNDSNNSLLNIGLGDPANSSITETAILPFGTNSNINLSVLSTGSTSKLNIGANAAGIGNNANWIEFDADAGGSGTGTTIQSYTKQMTLQSGHGGTGPSTGTLMLLNNTTPGMTLRELQTTPNQNISLTPSTIGFFKLTGSASSQPSISGGSGISGSTTGQNLLLQAGAGFGTGSTNGGSLVLNSGQANGAGTAGSINSTSYSNTFNFSGLAATSALTLKNTGNSSSSITLDGGSGGAAITGTNVAMTGSSSVTVGSLTGAEVDIRTGTGNVISIVSGDAITIQSATGATTTIQNNAQNTGLAVDDSSAALASPVASVNVDILNGIDLVNNTTIRYDIGSVVGTVPQALSNSATLDFGSTAAGASTDLTISVTDSALGDPVVLGVPNGSTLANGVFTAWVSSAGTVKVRFTNTNLVTALDPASGTFKVKVLK